MTELLQGVRVPEVLGGTGETTMNFKPMLSADASEVDLSTLRYPLLISPKLDGLRCIIWEGVAYSRNAKPFRNRHVQKWASSFHNLDGEITVGSPTAPDCLNVSKAVTAYEGEPDFTFHLFDSPERRYPGFIDSFDRLCGAMQGEIAIDLVPQFRVVDKETLLWHEGQFLQAGYEGIMLRDPKGPYKNGRSTMREGYLMKLKRFTDGEAVVVGLAEGKTNNNAPQRDELDRAKRSFVKSGLEANGMVGRLICKDDKWGEINVAPGIMSHAERRHYLAHPEDIIGQKIHWRSFGYGAKDAPRHARYYGIVEEI